VKKTPVSFSHSLALTDHFTWFTVIEPDEALALMLATGLAPTEAVAL